MTGGFLLAIIAIVAQYGTLSINEIVAAQQGGIGNWTLFTNPLAVAAAMLLSSRSPVRGFRIRPELGR